MPLAAGAPFPPLTLPDPQGRPRAVAEAWRRGDALLLVGHSDCRTTRQALPYLERIHRRVVASGRVLGVLQDQPREAAALADALGLTLPLVCEPDPYPLAQALELTTVPTFFLVTPDGRIAAVSEALRRADLEDFAGRFRASPLFEEDDPLPALKPG